MNDFDKSEKERKKLELKKKEEEFNKRLGENPKALKNQSKFKQIVWGIIIFFIVFYGFEFFLFLISFLQ